MDDDKFIQSLGMLYLACEPLVFDCIMTPEEIQALYDKIAKQTYDCHPHESRGSWLQALQDKRLQSWGLLYLACRRLIYDDKRTKEETKALHDLIEHHTFYCKHVELAIKDGVEPLGFEAWDKKAKNFHVTASVYKIDPIDPQKFGDQLTQMFSVETKEQWRNRRLQAINELINEQPPKENDKDDGNS